MPPGTARSSCSSHPGHRIGAGTGSNRTCGGSGRGARAACMTGWAVRWAGGGGGPGGWRAVAALPLAAADRGLARGGAARIPGAALTLPASPRPPRLRPVASPTITTPFMPMRVLVYKDLDIRRVKTAFTKVRAAIEAGDLRSADVKKLAPTPYWRAKLDYANRLLLQFVRHGQETVCLALEVI